MLRLPITQTAREQQAPVALAPQAQETTARVHLAQVPVQVRPVRVHPAHPVPLPALAARPLVVLQVDQVCSV